MSRSTLFTRSPPSEDNDPLLDHHNSISLQNLSPRVSSPISSSQRAASPSPPPSFYREHNQNAPQALRAVQNASPSYSPSRSLSRESSSSKNTHERRRIQFAAPPPPITNSVFLGVPSQFAGSPASTRPTSSRGLGQSQSLTARNTSPRVIRHGSGGIDPLLGLERRGRAIQSDLQALLDAQSAGLITGFGGGGEGYKGDDASSDAGSSTPTMSTRSLSQQGRERERQRIGQVVPVRQPKRKVVGLRGARRGLLRDMGALSELKGEEVSVLGEEINIREEVLLRVSEWEKRIEGARKRLSSYAGVRDPNSSSDTVETATDEESAEILELRAEEKAVDTEIREVEDRLLQMRARKRWLGERITEVTNKREARLSSYHGALREVESEVKDFLKRPPVPISVIMGDEEGIYALPPSRRTLGMAKEWWEKEVNQLQLRKVEVEKEKSALEEGSRLWGDCMGLVNGFEDELRKEMAGADAHDPRMLRGRINEMGRVITKLEEVVKIAEEKSWNLLICAVGAELEAFNEGEKMLKGVLDMIDPSASRREPEDDTNKDASVNGPEELDNSREDVEESEDDGPNLAELMIDRGHEGHGDGDG